MLSSISGGSFSPSFSVFGECFRFVTCDIEYLQILYESSSPGVPGMSSLLFGALGYPSHCGLWNLIVLHTKDVASQSESSSCNDVVEFACATTVEHLFFGDMVVVQIFRMQCRLLSFLLLILRPTLPASFSKSVVACCSFGSSSLSREMSSAKSRSDQGMQALMRAQAYCMT